MQWHHHSPCCISWGSFGLWKASLEHRKAPLWHRTLLSVAQVHVIPERQIKVQKRIRFQHELLPLKLFPVPIHLPSHSYYCSSPPIPPTQIDWGWWASIVCWYVLATCCCSQVTCSGYSKDWLAQG